MQAGPNALSEQIITELIASPPEARLLAVVRCERSERLARGSRSERALLHTVVVAARPAVGGSKPVVALAVGEAVLLTRYAQGPDPLTIGATYLVAAVREEYAPAYTLLGAVPIAAGWEQAELSAALLKLYHREPVAGAAPVLHATLAVEAGALVLRYVVENKRGEPIVVADRSYDLARRSFVEDAAVIERDAARNRLMVRRDGYPLTAAQSAWVQRVPAGGRGQGRIAIPLSSPSSARAGDSPARVVTVRKLELQLGWAPASAMEQGMREPSARVRHGGLELEALDGLGSAVLRPLSIEIAVEPAVELR